jgi:hypothetical protein
MSALRLGLRSVVRSLARHGATVHVRSTRLYRPSSRRAAPRPAVPRVRPCFCSSADTEPSTDLASPRAPGRPPLRVCGDRNGAGLTNEFTLDAPRVSRFAPSNGRARGSRVISAGGEDGPARLSHPAQVELKGSPGVPREGSIVTWRATRATHGAREDSALYRR